MDHVSCVFHLLWSRCYLKKTTWRLSVVVMATKKTETKLGKDDDAAAASEHDYAETTAANNSTSTDAADGGVVVQESSTTVGAEVDCPPVNHVCAFTPLQAEEEGPRKTDDATEFAAAATVASPVHRVGRRRPKQPEDRSCSACKVAFEKQGRSFNRRAVFTFTTPEAVQWVFPDSTTTVHDKSFLCETCAQVIRTKCSRRMNGKTALWLKPYQVCVRVHVYVTISI